MEDEMSRISIHKWAEDLVYTSVLDCKCSLLYVDDVAVVEEALRLAIGLGDGEKTRIKMLEVKIRKMKKEIASGQAPLTSAGQAGTGLRNDSGKDGG
jgi:hypothetical protein